MGLSDIVNQIKENCPCFEEKEMSELESMITTLIDLLSTSLCWNSSICGNFIRHVEVEKFDYINDSCFTCDCSSQIVKYDLFYTLKEIEIKIVEVTLITYSGLKETKIVLDPNSYTYRNGQILIDRTILPNNCCTCSCDEFVLSVAYETGFDKLPECLLPIFCELLINMSLSLTGCGSIDDCCTMTRPKAYSYLKSKKIGDISYAWGIDENQSSYIYEKMLNTSKLKMIGMLSLCNQTSLERIWWGKSC